MPKLGTSRFFPFEGETSLGVMLRSAFLVTFLLAVLLLTYFAVTGRLMFDRGDSSQRVLLSIQVSQDWTVLLSRQSLLGSVWPPGHAALQGSIIRLLLAAGLTDLSGILRALHLASLAMWSLGVYCLYKAVSTTSGILCGSLAGISLVGLPAILTLSHTGMSEIYTFGLFSIGVLCLSRYLRNERTSIYPAAVMFLVATLFRNEVIVLIGATALYLLLGKRFKDTAKFVGISSAYFASKLAYVVFVLRDVEVTFLNIHKMSHVSALFIDRAQELQALVLQFSALNGGYLVLFVLIFAWVGTIYLLVATKKWTWPSPDIVYWAILLGTFTAFIVRSVLTGNLAAQVRYTMFVAVFCVIFLSILIGKALLFLHSCEPQPRKRVLSVILTLFVVSSIGGMIAFTCKIPRFPGEVTDVIAWLGGNTTSEDVVTYDFLAWWSQPLMLYTSEPAKKSLNMCYSYMPPPKRTLPAELNNEDPMLNGLRITARFHQHLVDYRPKYAVLASEPFYLEIQTIGLKGYHHRHSYLRPYLTPEGSGDVLRFESPYLEQNLSIRFRLAYDNDMFAVYEVIVHEDEQAIPDHWGVGYVRSITGGWDSHPSDARAAWLGLQQSATASPRCFSEAGQAVADSARRAWIRASESGDEQTNDRPWVQCERCTGGART